MSDEKFLHLTSGPHASDVVRDEGSRHPALRVRCGSIPGKSLRIKATPPAEVIRKEAAVLDMIVPMFERAVVATSGTKTNFFFLLEPSAEQARLEWGPFYVEGNFRIAEKVLDARKAGERFRAFKG